jgi:hypothetical protein
MILTSTTDILSLNVQHDGDIDVVVTYIDRDQTTGAIGAAGRQLTNILSLVTNAEILASPAANTYRKVQSITIRNAHASTSNDVIVQFLDFVTLYELHAARLYPTEMLSWNEQTGWSHKCRSPKKAYDSAVLQGGNAQSNSATAGATSALPAELKIPVSDVGTNVRVFGCLGLFCASSVLTTTGINVGFRVYDQALIAGRESVMAANLSSVTASTWSAFSRATMTSTPLDQGTGPTTECLMIVGAGASYTEAVKRGHTVVCPILGSEIAASAVTLAEGNWFELFEATD